MACKVPTWAKAPHDDVEHDVEVRLNDDGTIDEIVTHRAVKLHMEQMDEDRYWIGLSDPNDPEWHQHIWLTREGKRIYPTVCR